MATLVDDIVLLIDCLMHYIVSGWHDLVTVPIGEKLILSWTLQAMKFFTVSLVLELETIIIFFTHFTLKICLRYPPDELLSGGLLY